MPTRNRPLTTKDFICEKHFEPNLVIRKIENEIYTVIARCAAISFDVAVCFLDPVTHSKIGAKCGTYNIRHRRSIEMPST